MCFHVFPLWWITAFARSMVAMGPWYLVYVFLRCQNLRTLQRRLQLRQKPLGLHLARLPDHSEKSSCGTGGKSHVWGDQKISVLKLQSNK
jgi:hypothetical protein